MSIWYYHNNKPNTPAMSPSQLLCGTSVDAAPGELVAEAAEEAELLVPLALPPMTMTEKAPVFATKSLLGF